jgi:hypothetical protein
VKRLIFLAASLVFATPASAGKSEDIATCAWSKLPTTTEKYRVSTGRDEVEPFMRIVAICSKSGSINLKGLKKAVEKTRPEMIGPDLENPTVYVKHGVDD